MIFEKLKKLIIAYIANNFKLSNKLTRVENHFNQKLQSLEETFLTKSMELEKAFNKRIAESETKLNKQLMESQKRLDSTTQALLKKSMENEILALRDSVLPCANLPIRSNHFVLLSYNKHIPKYSHHNLGDFIQTLATKNALLSLNPKTTFEFFDRDSLISYYPAGGGGK